MQSKGSLHSNNSKKLSLPYEVVTHGRRKSNPIHRGTSVNAGGSTAILLEDIDHFSTEARHSVIKTSNNSRGSNTSSKCGYMANLSVNNSFEEPGKRLSLSDIIPCQNQMRGRLTL